MAGPKRVSSQKSLADIGSHLIGNVRTGDDETEVQIMDEDAKSNQV